MEFLTLIEAAKFLRISRETIYRMLNRGDLPHYRIGKKYLFKKEELVKCLPSVHTKVRDVSGKDDLDFGDFC